MSNTGFKLTKFKRTVVEESVYVKKVDATKVLQLTLTQKDDESPTGAFSANYPTEVLSGNIDPNTLPVANLPAFVVCDWGKLTQLFSSYTYSEVFSSDQLRKEYESCLTQDPSSILDLLGKNNVVELENVLIHYYGGHLLFNGNGKMIPTVYRFNHCNGIISTGTGKQHNENFEEIVDFLRKLPEVSNVLVKEIPSYNASFFGQLEVTFQVCLGIEKANILWDLVKEAEYPSVRYKESLVGRAGYYLQPEYDMLGIYPLIKAQKELNENV